MFLSTKILFSTSVITALACALVLARLAPYIGLIDHPGGRKDHAHATPVVGGLAIYLSATGIGLVAGFPDEYLVFLGAASIILVAGIVDDFLEIAPLPKFLLQAAAATVMALAGGVVLRSVGNLVGLGSIGTSILAVPISIFAVLGVINSINMMDGIDGLAGSVSAVVLAAYAYVAYASNLPFHFYLLLILLGTVVGFLILNIRFPWQQRVRIFLGDTGSMLLGFIIAWYAIDLTQGMGRTFPPICALWVVVIPLCDCVSLMVRRLRVGKSPLRADRQHLHHFLLGRGMTVSQTQATIVIATLVCAGIGIAGWRLHIPEPLLFAGFVLLFFVYHLGMIRAFRGQDVMTTGMRIFSAKNSDDI